MRCSCFLRSGRAGSRCAEAWRRTVRERPYPTLRGVGLALYSRSFVAPPNVLISYHHPARTWDVSSGKSHRFFCVWELKMDYPAWVQAVGSVLAIVIAGRTVELTARRSRLDRLYGVDGVFNFCAITARDAALKVQDGLLRPDDLQMFPAHRLKDCESMLASIAALVVEIGSEKLPQMTSDATELIRSSAATLKASQLAVGVTNDLAANGILLHDNAKKMEELRDYVSTFVDSQRRRVRFWWIPFFS